MRSLAEVQKITGSTTLQHATTGDGGGFVGYAPTAGVSYINVLCVIEMGNAADMTLTLQTADDASGTNATALTDTVPIWKDFVKQTAAKAVTETASTGTFIYIFQVPALLIPDSKFLGISSDAGNAANIYSAICVEDVYYKA